jgi:hypothetical protein
LRIKQKPHRPLHQDRWGWVCVRTSLRRRGTVPDGDRESPSFVRAEAKAAENIVIIAIGRLGKVPLQPARD